MTSDARPGASRLTAGKATATFAALLVLSLVVPPVLATCVANARLDRARRDIGEIAAAQSARRDGAGDASAAVVLTGRGRVPKTSDVVTGAWLSASRGSLTAQPDPWGNMYLVRMRGTDSPSETGAAAPEDRGVRLPVVVLSAGPNGMIETSFERPTGHWGFGGDDLGLRLRAP